MYVCINFEELLSPLLFYNSKKCSEKTDLKKWQYFLSYFTICKKLHTIDPFNNGIAKIQNIFCCSVVEGFLLSRESVVQELRNFLIFSIFFCKFLTHFS